MFSITFVCLGNICRSPMAEAVFCRIAEERGVALSFRVRSFATSDCEAGNPVYPPVQRVLREKGYNFSHRSKQLTLADVKNSDYVLVMDGMNFADVNALTGGNCADKIFMLGRFLPEGGDIADPWYTRDFERTYREIFTACNAFMDWIISEHGQSFEYDKRH